MLKRPAENERERKLWGEQEGKQSWMYMGGEGSREVEECPVRMRAFQACAWEGCSEDAHDCFKVPLYVVNESGSGVHQDTSVFSLLCLCEHLFVRGWHCVERALLEGRAFLFS